MQAGCSACPSFLPFLDYFYPPFLPSVLSPALPLPLPSLPKTLAPSQRTFSTKSNDSGIAG
jgi:hypothetical protein